MSGWKVQISHVGNGQTQDTQLWWNGAFEFHEIVPGEHRVRVIDDRGHVVHNEMVSLRRDGETLYIRFRPDGVPPNGPGERISVQQLNHKSPRKALNELKSGRAAMDKQQFTRALGHLQTAVTVDPASADAHNDLGVAYFQLAQYQQSLEQFRTAIELAPTHERANNNLCLVLLKTEHYEEAGQAASGVLKRGAGTPMAHYAAAVALLAGGGSMNEALDHLRRAQGAMPQARLLTARVLAHAGRRDDAARELEGYLRSPEADADAKRPELEAWLAELRR
jgi:Tfp pilus assembly protein PilF